MLADTIAGAAPRRLPVPANPFEALELDLLPER
jgi:hypothetical protein